MATTPSKKFRVLVVDDSTFMRKVLETIFNADEQLQVVGQAKDGREAVALAESLKPDVITMDINMPHMDGLQATAQIMTTNPKPIVIVSSESREGASSTLKALELGAIEFVAKPSGAIDLDMNSVKDELLRKVRMAAKVRVVRTASRLATTLQSSNGHAGAPAKPAAPRVSAVSSMSDQRFPVVVLAASTGGPATVMRLAPGFTKDFPAAVILVQHMPAAFTTQYAAQLEEFTGISVKEAVAAFAGPMAIAAILTGMGNDGANGAKAIKSAGGIVLAQDEATSVIFGMPAEAIKTGAVEQVLPIDDIYAAIEKRVLNLCRPTPVGVR